MSTTIAGHDLTNAEVRVLDKIEDYMRKFAGDSFWGPSTSPKGDGRWVPLREIFPERNITGNANRKTARRLIELGVLKACEIQHLDGQLRGGKET